MCWTGIAFNFCYDCAKEYDHRAHTIPCRAAENNEPCTLVYLENYIVQTEDNCATCKASQAAEEECQRQARRSRPLNLHVKGRKRFNALASAYRDDLIARRHRTAQLARNAEVYKGLVDTGRLRRGRYGDDAHDSAEELAVAPMFITSRHQPNTSGYTGGASRSET
ncbi:hypothetical protein ANO14919_116670 [Xylariales sp. No.14919]|nr:hypothetical protein ANO14919_116670 [Xylariales sp. No.14919]